MSDVYVDWSKAPEGTTHVYRKDGIAIIDSHGLPQLSNQWEKITPEGTYDWNESFQCWQYYSKEVSIENRIARPVVQPIANICKIKKLRESAQLPVRATPTAAGYDVSWSSAFADDEEGFVNIGPQRVMQLGTGLAFELPTDVAMLVLPRSGLATKRRLRPANTPGLVDSDYRGELIVALENFGDSPQKIHPGDRIAQIVFINPLQMNFEEVDELSSTERGEGGFGSTGVSS